jgi:predicted metal-binding membrane protein
MESMPGMTDAPAMMSAGVMNVVAMAAIAIFVLIEKIVPRGIAFSRLAGVALLACGAGVAFFACGIVMR